MSAHPHVKHPPGGGTCLSRRQLLIFGGVSLGVLAVPGFATAGTKLVGSRYPAIRIAALAELEEKKPIDFNYPDGKVANFLVKLGEPAGGGIGPHGDIVAFNATCTHMGGPVGGEVYKPVHNVLGPCPIHLTTFDLTRHGMVVSGHATESLPQVMLEVRGGDVFAVGVMGLIFGYVDNPRGA
jgi:arsenite oxidase small subunit